MAEIDKILAGDMDPDDTRCLLNWRDHTEEGLVSDLTIQQLLDLYHASSEYITLESWLADDENAPAKYAQITDKS